MSMGIKEILHFPKFCLAFNCLCPTCMHGCNMLLRTIIIIFFSVDSTAPDFRYNQPKFIVFYKTLLKLFLLFCFNCKAENLQVTMRQNGTMVTVTQECGKCEGFVWNSQSYMPHGKYPAGNMLLSLAVLMAGASISKVLLLFRHLGLCCYSPRTFFSHQHLFNFPNCHPPLGVVQSWPC